jgi:ATP-binding cassette subfamily B protein
VKNCDRILYIDDYGVKESGSHDQLMAEKGAYYRLYTAQSQKQNN